MNSSKASRIKILFRLSVGGLLLLLLFQMVDWRHVFPLFRDIRLGPFVGMIALYPLTIWVSTVKWQRLLRPHGIKVSTYELFRHYWTGIFFSNFLPSSVGGDVSRVALLQRFGRPAEVAASVVVERLTGVCILLMVAIASLIARPELFRHEWLPVFSVIVLSLSGGLLCVLCFSGNIAASLPAVTAQERSWFWLALGKGKKLAASISLYRNMPVILWQNLLLSVVFYLLSVLGHYLSFQIFSIDLNFFDIFFIAGWISLISFVPISLNGLGITEGAFVFFYGAVGVLPSEALAVALLIRFMALLCSSVGGLFLLFSGNKVSPAG